MTFNSVNQLSASHRVWDHVGNIIPVTEYCAGDRPHLEGKPAAWLPVQFWDKYYENWLVTMPGKILSGDPQGRIVPAQYMLGSSAVTYTTNDVTYGTIDVRNGNACTSASVSASPITLSGLTWMGVSGVSWAIKPPVGVAPYPFLQWAGDGSVNDTGNNPAYWRHHNYNMQHRVALLCDSCLLLPYVPASQTATSLAANTWASNVQTCTAVSNLPVALNTTRTPIAFTNGNASDVSTRFVNQVTAAADVTAAGDWHINYQTGVVTVYATSSITTGDYNIAYYHYASAASTVSVFGSVLGAVGPSDQLKSDSNSNWVLATPKVYGTENGDNFDTFSYIMGQVLELQAEPTDYLDRVRTAYSSLSTSATGALPGSAGQMDQMPGSATGGVSSLVNYAGAANLVAVVNLVSR